MPHAPKPNGAFDGVIIGAGFAGMYMLYRLRTLGLSVIVLERGDGVGGTWYWNRYPGARCDSESWYYAYAFSENLQQEWEWTERYASQPEVLRYLNHVADRFDLRRDIRLGSNVTEAAFCEEANQWQLRTDIGEEYTARFLITAVGCLSTAIIPDIPGQESFGGELLHTGRWPHGHVEFAGKSVGVIGTGSTGIQVIPIVAEQARHLTVFQRTPNYSVPARNGPMDPTFQDEIKARYGKIRARQRNSVNGHPLGEPDPTPILDLSDGDRRALCERAWQQGGLRFRAAFPELTLNRDVNSFVSQFIRDKIREAVSNPEVAEKLVPRDHGFGTKRPPIDTNYFETYNRDNVTLVDLRQTPIREITPTGVCTTATEHQLDSLILATGFDAITGPLLSIDIRGKEGQTLRDKWADGPRTYLGLQAAGYPNMFTITGPGSPSLLVNVPTAIEQHVEWITRCIDYMLDRGIARIEATEEAEAAWLVKVQEAAERSLLPLAGSSYYLGANVPGKPRVFMPYVGGFSAYTKVCDDVAGQGYTGFELTRS